MRFKSHKQRKWYFANKNKYRTSPRPYIKFRINQYEPQLIIKPKRNSKISFEGKMSVMGGDLRIKRKITKNSYVVVGTNSTGPYVGGSHKNFEYTRRIKKNESIV